MLKKTTMDVANQGAHADAPAADEAAAQGNDAAAPVPAPAPNAREVGRIANVDGQALITRFPPFAGTTETNTYESAAWLLQVEGIIGQTGMSGKDELIMGMVKRAFTGDAMVWYRRLAAMENPALATWATFLELFKKRWKVSLTYAQRSAMITGLVQGEHETAAKFMDRVTLTMSDVFEGCKPDPAPASGEGANSLKWKKIQFFECLTAYIKLKFITGLRTAARKECERSVTEETALDEVLRIAETEEAANRRQAPAFMAPVAAPPTAEEVAAFRRQRQQPQQQQQQQRQQGGANSSGGTRGSARAKQQPKKWKHKNDGKPPFVTVNGRKLMKCWNCGGHATHTAQNCPLPFGQTACLEEEEGAQAPAPQQHQQPPQQAGEEQASALLFEDIADEVSSLNF